MLNKLFYILDRPWRFGFPLALLVGGLAAIIDTIVGNIIEAIQWGML